MRSPTERLAAALALLLAGCGTWSNEDVRFLEALPTREELQVEVPASLRAAAAGDGAPVAREVAVTLPWCGALGAAETWLWAKPTSDRLNGSIDWVIGLVDVVRRFPPTRREADARTWGPFPDERRPGVELRVVITRRWPAGPEGPVEHAYAFEARRPALAEPFAPILAGAFTGPSAARGTGALTLAFDEIRRLGLNDPDAPTGRMDVVYDRAGDPRTTRLDLVSSPGFGLAQFGYAFDGFADGRGRLAYAFVNAAGDRAEVAAAWNVLGGGQADVRYFPAGAGGASVGYRQCWNALACLVYSDDVSGYSCGGGACAGGDPAACPAVPAP